MDTVYDLEDVKWRVPILAVLPLVGRPSARLAVVSLSVRKVPCHGWYLFCIQLPNHEFVQFPKTVTLSTACYNSNWRLDLYLVLVRLEAHREHGCPDKSIQGRVCCAHACVTLNLMVLPMFADMQNLYHNSCCHLEWRAWMVIFVKLAIFQYFGTSRGTFVSKDQDESMNNYFCQSSNTIQYYHQVSLQWLWSNSETQS